MEKLFTQEVIKLLSIAGIVTVSLTSLLGILMQKILGSFVKYRKQLALHLLLFIVLFLLLGLLGHSSVFFSPTIMYVVLQVCCFLLGLLHLHLMQQNFKFNENEHGFWLELLFTLAVAGFGFVAFYILFSYFNREGYSLLFCSAIFIFICSYFIYQCFERAMDIPMKIYKKWFYPMNTALKDPDESKLKNMLVISFEFIKKPDDSHYTNFRSKAPNDMDFGQLFYFFINDYNDRHPNEKIVFKTDGEQPFGWIFYKKRKWYQFITRYIDADSSFYMNKIKENDIIVCNRI